MLPTGQNTYNNHVSQELNSYMYIRRANEILTLKPALVMILISAGSLSPNLTDTMSPTTSLSTERDPNTPSRRTKVSYNYIKGEK